MIKNILSLRPGDVLSGPVCEGNLILYGMKRRTKVEGINYSMSADTGKWTCEITCTQTDNDGNRTERVFRGHAIDSLEFVSGVREIRLDEKTLPLYERFVEQLRDAEMEDM